MDLLLQCAVGRRGHCRRLRPWGERPAGRLHQGPSGPHPRHLRHDLPPVGHRSAPLGSRSQRAADCHLARRKSGARHSRLGHAEFFRRKGAGVAAAMNEPVCQLGRRGDGATKPARNNPGGPRLPSALPRAFAGANGRRLRTCGGGTEFHWPRFGASGRSHRSCVWPALNSCSSLDDLQS